MRMVYNESPERLKKENKEAMEGGKMSTANEIYENVKALPEPIMREVLDFVEFMRKKATSQTSEPVNQTATPSDWPEIIQDYLGEPDFPPFEAERSELSEPNEDPLS